MATISRMEMEKISDLPLTKLADIAISLLKVEQPSMFKEILSRVMKDSGLVFDDEDPVEFLIRYIEERKSSVGSSTIGSTIAEMKRTAGREVSAIPYSIEPPTLMVGGSYVNDVFLAICSIVLILTGLLLTTIGSTVSGGLLSGAVRQFQNVPTINSLGVTVPGAIGFLLPFIAIITKFVSSELRGDTTFTRTIARPFIAPFVALNRALQPKRYLYVIYPNNDIRGKVAILYFSTITGKILTDNYNNIKYSIIQDYDIWHQVGWAQGGLAMRFYDYGYEVDDLLHVPHSVINSMRRLIGPEYVNMNKDQFDSYLRTSFLQYQEGYRPVAQARPQAQPQAQPQASPGRKFPRPAGLVILQAFHNSATVPEPPELASNNIIEPITGEDIEPGTKYAFVDRSPPIFALTWDYFQNPTSESSLFHNADGTIIRRGYDPITENGEIQIMETGERLPATQLKWTIRVSNINNIVNEIVNAISRRRTQAQITANNARTFLNRGRGPNTGASASGRRRGRSGGRGGRRTIRRKFHKGRHTRRR